MNLPDDFIPVHTGQLYLCPRTGQLEQPAVEGICPHPTRPMYWRTCTFLDASHIRRGEPGYDGNWPEWHGEELSVEAAARLKTHNEPAGAAYAGRL